MPDPSDRPRLRVHPEVAEALHAGTGVVALESTLISHGLPQGRNLEVARDVEAAVRRSGAVPATVALLDGAVMVGLDDSALERVATDDDVVKASIRDVPIVLARKAIGATTVASTTMAAALAGIRVFATGGLGGVHREASSTFDESADLRALADYPTTVVCAGVKSILDVGATLERLETLSVGLIGYRTDRFPGFYVRDSGHDLDWRVDDVEEIAAVLAARDDLGLRAGLVVANPISAEAELPAAAHDETLRGALAALAESGVHGKDVTPFLLAYFHQHTGGASLGANIALILGNATLAGEIAQSSRR